MYTRIPINILIIIFISALQLSFINGLPLSLSNFNLILVSLIFILVIGGRMSAIWWAVGMGLVLDFYSFLFFGTYLLSLIFTVFMVNFLLVNFFTNRSLYSFIALIFFGTMIYEILLLSISYFVGFAKTNNSMIFLNLTFWKLEASQLLLNILGAVIMFYVFNFISNKLKPVFIIRG